MIVGMFANAEKYFNQSDVQLGIKNEFKCGTNLVCSIVSGKLVMTDAPLVLASATTITKAQCGSTFYNSGAVELAVVEMPYLLLLLQLLHPLL